MRLFRILLYVSLLILTYFSLQAKYANTSFIEVTLENLELYPILNLQEIEKCMDLDSQTILHREWWKILKGCNNPNAFSMRISTTENSAEDNDSIIYLTDNLQNWIKFVIYLSDTYYYTGEGSTIWLQPKQDTLPQLNSITPLVYKGFPINYTQCLAALTWYDINKSLLDSRAFFFFCGTEKPLRYDSVYSQPIWFDYQFRPLNYLPDVSISEIEKYPDYYQNIVREKNDSLILLADSVFKSIKSKSIPVRPCFHLWQREEMGKLFVVEAQRKRLYMKQFLSDPYIYMLSPDSTSWNPWRK